MKHAKTATEFLDDLNAHVVYTPTQAVIRSLATGNELARIGRLDDLHAALTALAEPLPFDGSDEVLSIADILGEH
jgi:hypothetical protein